MLAVAFRMAGRRGGNVKALVREAKWPLSGPAFGRPPPRGGGGGGGGGCRTVPETDFLSSQPGVREHQRLLPMPTSSRPSALHLQFYFSVSVWRGTEGGGVDAHRERHLEEFILTPGNKREGAYRGCLDLIASQSTSEIAKLPAQLRYLFILELTAKLRHSPLCALPPHGPEI